MLDMHIYDPSKKNKPDLTNAAFIKTVKIMKSVGYASKVYTKKGIEKPNADTYFIKDEVHSTQYFQPYVELCVEKQASISDKVPMKDSEKNGGYEGESMAVYVKERNSFEENKILLENFKHFVFNTNVGHFLNIVLPLDQNAGPKRSSIPFICDKKYSDTELYKKLRLNSEEISIIETTCKKFERNSPWFKRYMCGPDSVSDKEVNNFINNL
jgi:hypothetical protein